MASKLHLTHQSAQNTSQTECQALYTAEASAMFQEHYIKIHTHYKVNTFIL